MAPASGQGGRSAGTTRCATGTQLGPARPRRGPAAASRCFQGYRRGPASGGWGGAQPPARSCRPGAHRAWRGGGPGPARSAADPSRAIRGRAGPCRAVPPQACGGRCARRRGPGPAPRPGWRRRGAAPAAPAALPGVLPRHETQLSALLGAAAAPGACVYSNTQPCSGCETMEINSVLPSAINRGYYLGKDALPPAGCSEAMLSLSSLPAPEAAAPARGSRCRRCPAVRGLWCPAGVLPGAAIPCLSQRPWHNSLSRCRL